MIRRTAQRALFLWSGAFFVALTAAAQAQRAVRTDSEDAVPSGGSVPDIAERVSDFGLFWVALCFGLLAHLGLSTLAVVVVAVMPEDAEMRTPAAEAWWSLFLSLGHGIGTIVWTLVAVPVVSLLVIGSGEGLSSLLFLAVLISGLRLAMYVRTLRLEG